MMLAILAAVVTSCAIGKFAYDYFRTKKALLHQEDEGERLVSRGLEVITRRLAMNGYAKCGPWELSPATDEMCAVFIKNGETRICSKSLKEIAEAVPMHPDVGNRKQRRALRSIKRAST